MTDSIERPQFGVWTGKEIDWMNGNWLAQCAVCQQYGDFEDTDAYESEFDGIKMVADNIRICHSCKELATSFGTNYIFFIPR